MVPFLFMHTEMNTAKAARVQRANVEGKYFAEK